VSKPKALKKPDYPMGAGSKQAGFKGDWVAHGDARPAAVMRPGLGSGGLSPAIEQEKTKI